MAHWEFFAKYKKYFINSIGIMFIVSGSIMILFWPDIFSYIFNKEMELRPGTRAYHQWRKSSESEPLYLDIYFFNWTNPGDFKNLSTKPILQEVGPYRFREVIEKVNITWNNHNSTVSFRKQSTYFFEEEQSLGKLSDEITSLNMIALSAANRARDWSYFMKKGVSVGLTMNNKKLHVTKTAGELLFDGYEDSMINIAKNMPLLDAGEIPFDKFGWFYSRNASSDLLGSFNIHTGVEDIMKIGQLMEWNHQRQLNLYDGECDIIKGSGGDFFPGLLKKSQVLSMFSPEMCRSVYMEYEEELDIHGVTTYRFAGGDRTLDNGTLYDENICYCGGQCVPSGVMNVSACRFGTPVFMSFPHFYKADPFYLNQVEGMKPSKEKHQFFMAFEPKTGIPLEVAARFQLNILVREVEKITIYENIPKETYMPILWFEQHVKMSETVSSEIADVLMYPIKGQLSGIVFVIIGVLVIIFVPFLNLIKKINKQKICDKKSFETFHVDLTKNTETSLFLQKNPPTDNLSNNHTKYVRKESEM